LPNYTIEGKILGQYIKQHFAGQKVGVLYQDDDFGQGGLAGIKDELPASQIASAQAYQPGTTTLAPQVTALKAAGAKVVVEFSVPIYTAIARLTSFTLGYKPQLVVSNVGSDPTTVAGLLKGRLQGQGVGHLAARGRDHRRLPPVGGRHEQPVVVLFKKIHDQNDASAPFDGNVGVRDGQRVHPRPGAPGGGQEPHPPGALSTPSQSRAASGPARASSRSANTATQHGGYAGVEMGSIRGGVIVLDGKPLTTRSDPNRRDRAVLRQPAGAPGQRRAEQLSPTAPSRSPAGRPGWPGHVELWQPQRPERARARSSTASSISAVRTPVNVFCWLG